MTTRTESRLVDDRGTAATIVLFPLFTALVFVFVQATMWQRDRQLAAAAADRTSAAVALYGADAGSARTEAVAWLQRSGMREIDVRIDTDSNESLVVITATAPGMLVGTSSRVSARSVTPVERFRSP